MRSNLPTQARSAIKAAPETWQQWLDICRIIEEEDDFELLAEDFGLFLTTFTTLRRLGVPFDPLFVAQVDAMVAAAVDVLDDLVEDGTDSDEDGDERNLDFADKCVPIFALSLPPHSNSHEYRRPTCGT